MQILQRYHSRLIGLSLGVMLALLIWPATRGLVRSQFALSVPTAASVAPWSGEITNTPVAWSAAQRQYHATALRHPDDYQIQFADAVVSAPAQGNVFSEVRVQRLRDLTERFRGCAPLYAAALRFATLQQIRIEREEEKWLAGERAPIRTQSEPPRNTPGHLAAYDRDAAAGERLDPDNAYFPMMRAIGQFAAHRDSEALAAIQRAAQKPVWNDYCTEEIEGEWKLHQETFGEVSALPRLVFAYDLLLPHYVQLRPLCRVAIALAAQQERTGKTEEGLEIRESVRKCGRLIRIQSPNVIGSMRGIALNQVSMLRPGGAPRIPDSQHGSREQRAREFDAYLAKIGHAQKIAEWHAESDAGVQVREVVRFGAHEFFDIVPPNLASLWIAALILLSNALWMLALGGTAALVARHRAMRAAQGLPQDARIGAALGLAAGSVVVLTGILPTADPISYFVMGAVLLSSIVACAKDPHWLFISGAPNPNWLRRIGAFGVSFALTALLCSAFAWQIGGSTHPIVQLMWGVIQEGATPIGPVIQGLCVGLAALIPLLSLLTFSVLSRLWRVPLSVGVVRGLRGSGVPIACVLLLAYGILVPFILRQESTLDYGLRRTVQHEGRFEAELGGKTWPGDPH